MGGWSQRNELSDGKSCAGVAVVWGCVIVITLVFNAIGFDALISCLLGVLGGIFGYIGIKIVQSLRKYFSKDDIFKD